MKTYTFEVTFQIDALDRSMARRELEELLEYLKDELSDGDYVWCQEVEDNKYSHD